MERNRKPISERYDFDSTVIRMPIDELVLCEKLAGEKGMSVSEFVLSAIEEYTGLQLIDANMPRRKHKTKPEKTVQDLISVYDIRLSSRGSLEIAGEMAEEARLNGDLDRILSIRDEIYHIICNPKNE